MVEEADLHCWVSSSGQLEYRRNARSSPILGETSLDRRIWIGSPARHWTPENPGYGGNPTVYADIIRSILNMTGVQYAWYGVLTDDFGSKGLPAVIDEWLSAYFVSTAVDKHQGKNP